LSKDVYKFNADNFGAFDSKIAALENESRLPDKFFRALFEGADDGQAPGGGLMEDTA